ncbi:unnamed protein product [Trichobilharzia regenti]|nr:unnamed protein product [Trichobilharzia regenti]
MLIHLQLVVRIHLSNLLTKHLFRLLLIIQPLLNNRSN